MADNIPGANPSPDVAPNPLPTPFNENRVSPEEFGAGTGAELQQQGAQEARAASNLVDRHNFAADEAAISQAYGLVSDKIRNPQTGFMALRGQDALAKLGDARQQFTDSIAKVRQGLTAGQSQRIGFRLDRIEKDGLFDAESWARQQGNIAGEAAFHGAETAAGDRLAQLSGDPTVSQERLRSTLLELTGTATSRAKFRYGENAPPDAIKAEVISTVANAVPKAMSEAIATGDPKQAAKALELFGPYLGVHAKLYTGAVNKMLAQQLVTHTGEQILGAATSPVPLPGGGVVARVDEGKLGTLLTSMPDNEHRADIYKYVKDKQAVYDDVWKKTVAQQLDAAKRQGDPGAMGSFDMKLVRPDLRVWLQQNDEDGLIGLAKLQSQENTQARREAVIDSGMSRELVASQFLDKDHRDQLMKTTPEEFQAGLLKGVGFDGQPLFAKLSGSDVKTLVANYRQAQKDAGASQLDEKPESTVKAAIARAADNDPVTIKDLTARLAANLNSKAKAYVAQKKGTVSTDQLADYIDKELAFGKVEGSSGRFWPDDTARRIEAQTSARYGGLRFVPAEAAGGEPEVLGAQTPAAAAAQPAQKAVRGYRYTKDRKQRVPVFSDGSQGTLEANPEATK